MTGQAATAIGRRSDTRTDQTLVDATRAGDISAYAVLWERHSGASRRAARSITSSGEPDDLVSEAFACTLSAIKNGGGPTDAFRPYILAAIRHAAARWRAKRLEEHSPELDRMPLEGSEAGDERFANRSLLVDAFRTLPERWRTLLWYLEVEGMKPREIAPLMGMTANGVSALSVRAHEGLRRAWLHAHVADPSRPAECQWVCERIIRGGSNRVAARDRGRFDAHVAGCRSCVDTARDVNRLA